MVAVRSVLLVPVLTLLLLCGGAHALSDERCIDGGQCSNMLKSFGDLIQGDGCNSFYYTGKCSRICTFSLKSLMARHTWATCAKRCHWQPAIVDAANSWLAMCLARPAPDVFEKDDDDDAEEEKRKRQLEQAAANAASNITSSARNIRGLTRLPQLFWVILLGVVIVALFVLTMLIVTKSAMGVRVKYGIRRATNWVKVVVFRTSGKTAPGNAPLDVGPQKSELRNLQRGARRHLKALRATLD